ncbi:MAG TPA: hypothetical protein VMA95_00885 [Streptosporangiaceae bacterium]|nr:hypothetical protein [Streptosporangiaceae bacterium]
MTAAEVSDQVIETMIITALLFAEAFGLLLCGLHWALSRRRLAAWDAEWESIDPLRTRLTE